MLDYTFERQIELEKRDSFAEGKIEGNIEGEEKGIKKGTVKTVISMGHKFGLSDHDIIENIKDELSVPLDIAQALFKEMQSHS